MKRIKRAITLFFRSVRLYYYSYRDLIEEIELRQRYIERYRKIVKKSSDEEAFQKGIKDLARMERERKEVLKLHREAFPNVLLLIITLLSLFISIITVFTKVVLSILF